MIAIENTAVYGWEAAIRGMRNPMNSWKKIDSVFSPYYAHGVSIGENDLALMKRLVKAGSDHAKFLRMINLTADVTAPLYWWKEFDTYKIGTVANSCSTMHKIADKEFTLDDFSHEHLFAPGILECVIKELNFYRKCYIDYDERTDNAKPSKKELWWQLVQLLPSSYNQKRTVQLNYAVLRNMYHARRNHKLDEWRDFCAWVETLPYHELITE